jgi:NADH:ubiquinone oxidoreductase subunit C
MDEWRPFQWKALEEVVERSRAVYDEPSRHYCKLADEDLLRVARYLHSVGARLLTIAATTFDERDVQLTYTFELGKCTLMLRAESHSGTVDSLFSLFACADFLEREVNNLFGVKFLGHPNLTHLPGRAGFTHPT